MPSDERVFTVKELAKYLKVHASTIYRLVQSGEMPAFKIGGDWRFNKESIDRWRLEQEQSHGRAIKTETSPPNNNATSLLTREDNKWLIDLHGNQKLFIDASLGKQMLFAEDLTQ